MNVRFVVPARVDDPARPSGGNVYDRRLRDALVAAGWQVREHRVAGPAGLGPLLATLPDGSTVLVDGLVGATSGAMVAEAGRLRLVLLLHMAVADPEVLDAVDAVVTTGRWARDWAVLHGADAGRAHVAEPGVDLGPVVPGSPAGGGLLCVGPVTRAKGHDVLVAALAAVRDLGWRCACVGALDLEPAFAEEVRSLVRSTGLDDRVTFTGPLPADRLDALRSGTDLVLSASRGEAYGMALTEGLARGIPALVTDVGGHPEAVGGGGVLVPVDDPTALAAALRGWLTDAGLRARLRRAAAARRTSLPGWAETARVMAGVLNPAAPVHVSTTSGSAD